MASLDAAIMVKEKEVLANAGRAALGMYHTEEFLSLIDYDVEELYALFSGKVARDGYFSYSKAIHGYLAMKIARLSSLGARDEKLVEYYLGHHEFEGLMSLVEDLEAFKHNLSEHVVNILDLGVDQMIKLLAAHLQGGKPLMMEKISSLRGASPSWRKSFFFPAEKRK
jgi:hypothetical protein